MQPQPGNYGNTPPMQSAPRSKGILIASLVVCWIVTIVVSFWLGRESLRAELRNAITDAFTNSFGPNSSPGAVPESVATEDLELVETTPLELYNYFGENSVQATDWAKNKRIRITATVDYVSGNMFGGEDSAVVIEIPTSGYIKPSLEFWFGPEERQVVGSLREGQRVTLEGKFIDQSFSGDLKFDGLKIQQ